MELAPREPQRLVSGKLPTAPHADAQAAAVCDDLDAGRGHLLALLERSLRWLDRERDR